MDRREEQSRAPLEEAKSPQNIPVVPFPVPASPRTGGNEYVWHCHILEHEEHNMMRPLIVT